MSTPGPRPYAPPVDDQPLDELELAFARAVISALLKEIREEEADARAATSGTLEQHER